MSQSSPAKASHGSLEDASPRCREDLRTHAAEQERSWPELDLVQAPLMSFFGQTLAEAGHVSYLRKLKAENLENPPRNFLAVLHNRRGFP